MKLSYCAAALILVAVAGPLWAQAPAAPTEAQAISAPGDAPLTPEQLQLLNQKIDVGRIDINRMREILEGEAAVETLRMSLQDCIRLAVENSPELQIVRYEPLKSDADVLTAHGEFDPIASTTITYLNSTQQASPEYQTFAQITSIEAKRTTTKTSVSGKLEWGTLYDASFELDRESTTFTKFVPQWSGGLTLTLNQPLLRGRGAAFNLARIHMAAKAREIADTQVRLSLMNVAAEVIKAYWDLVGAVESLAVREQALANAERLLDIAQKRLDIGTGAAIEVLQAKAGVAMRQTDLVTARSQVSNAEDVVKKILNLRDDGLFSAKRIVPTDRPSVVEFDLESIRNVDEQLKKGYDLALAGRPEIVSARLEIETAKLDHLRASNATQPDVSVTGSLFQGQRGPEWTKVFEGVAERTDNFYTLGVKGSVPIGNRAARGASERADLTARQAELKLERTKQDLMLKVRLAARAVHTSQILVESNRQARTLQETNVAAEEKRLRLGVSTSYRVLQVQQDLTQAQTQEVQARIGCEKALVELRLAEGTILDSLGIQFEAADPEPPATFIRSAIAPKLPPR